MEQVIRCRQTQRSRPMTQSWVCDRRTWQCESNISLQGHGLIDFKNHADMGSFTGEGSSTWGWTSSDDREFVAVGQADGTAFLEITTRGKLVYLGRLPQQSIGSIWCEIRGY